MTEFGAPSADSHAFFGVEQQHPFFKLQQQALEMIALGRPVSETLALLALFLESVIADSYCAILMVEDDGKRLCVGAAPSLPRSFSEAFNGFAIGPGQAACGTAAYRRQPVICADIASDPLWENYRDWVMASFDIRAAWSQPVFCSKNHVIGTFSVFRRLTGVPGDSDLRLIERCKHLASIAIEKHCNEYALQQALIKAEAGNAAKTVFLANVSHELLTPLNAIIGYTDLLAEEANDRLGGKFRGDVEHIRTASKNLLQILNNVLHLTQLNSDEVKVMPQRFDIGAAVSEVVARFHPMMVARKLRLVTRLPQTPLVAQSDPGKYQQILGHLLDNAIKFCDQGSIEICIAVEGQGKRQTVVLKVSDSGIGIEAEKIASIFDVFTQADQSCTRQHGGVGLGLAVCAGLGKLLHGAFSINSAPGEGSTFIFSMPLHWSA